jgi:predicted ATPase
MDTAAELNRDVAADGHAKPPFLRRVRIRGYKSIEFCDVTLEPLTVLVGRNASGKSNFVNALAFLRAILEDGANAAVLDHGGPSVFSRLTDDNRMSFEIEALFPSHRKEWRATYKLELGLTAQKQVEVIQEVLRLTHSESREAGGFSALHQSVTWDGLEHLYRDVGRTFPRNAAVDTFVGPDDKPVAMLFDHYRPDRPLLGVIGNQPFIDLSGRLLSIDSYNFRPDLIRLPHPSFGSPVLERDGRNLARAIEGLREIDGDVLSRVGAYFRAVVDDVETFDVVPLGDYETIRFRLCAKPRGQTLVLNASGMSDGTLRVLACLVAAFQTQFPIGPSVVAIEEPETSLHPAAMRALVDALDEATGHTQILLTTHSADMLDNPTIRPENVRVVQMIDGRTVIGPVDAASVEIVKRQLNTLGGLERENRLEPDLDDLDRQKQLAARGESAA